MLEAGASDVALTKANGTVFGIFLVLGLQMLRRGIILAGSAKLSPPRIAKASMILSFSGRAELDRMLFAVQ